jgi:hypothetical protein
VPKINWRGWGKSLGQNVLANLLTPSDPVGTALKVLPYVAWLAAIVSVFGQGIPLAFLPGIALALLAAALVIINELDVWRRRNTPQPSSIAPGSPGVSPVSYSFKPHLSMDSKIMLLDFSGLWETDAYIGATVHVRDVSGCEITINGIAGSMQIAGVLCSFPALLTNGPRKLIESAYYDCQIRQPITGEMAKQLRAKSGSLNKFSGRLLVRLSHMRWVGEVTFPDGAVVLLTNAQAANDDGYVFGPIREQDTLKVAVRLELFLASQEWYHGNGIPKNREI